MTETQMDQNQFVTWAKEVLASDRTTLDLTRIARHGLKVAVLTAEEVAKLEGHSIVPDWLAKGLSTHESLEMSSIQPQVVIKGTHQVAALPTMLCGTELPHALKDNAGRSPAVKMFAGENGRFILQNFMKGAFTAEGCISDLSDHRNSWAWSFFRERSPQQLRGRSVIAVVEGSSVLSHWLFDTLPKLELMKLFGLPFRKVDNVVLVTDRVSFHQASLQALGIDRDRVKTRGSLGPFIACDEFYAVSDLRSGFFGAPWLYEMVRERFTPGERINEPWRKLFISRANATRRRVVNEAELFPVLDRWGFSILKAEDLTLQETAQLMAEATHIVAPHGAGLSNVVFAHDQAKVLELYGAHLSSEFWKICASRELPYYLFQCRASDGNLFREEQLKQMGFFERNGQDMRVPIPEFEAAMERFMKS